MMDIDIVEKILDIIKYKVNVYTDYPYQVIIYENNIVIHNIFYICNVKNNIFHFFNLLTGKYHIFIYNKDREVVEEYKHANGKRYVPIKNYEIE